MSGCSLHHTMAAGCRNCNQRYLLEQEEKKKLAAEKKKEKFNLSILTNRIEFLEQRVAALENKKAKRKKK